MSIALVKIDVAAADLNRSIPQVLELVDGGTLLEQGLCWVFDLANGPKGRRRDLRFWRPELAAWAELKNKQDAHKYSDLRLPLLIGLVLPEKRQQFHAGEVDQLFQIRPRTRIDFGAELNGAMTGGRNFYSRDALVKFLTTRWLGAPQTRKTTTRTPAL